MVGASHDPAPVREVLKDVANGDAVLIGGIAADPWCFRYGIAPGLGALWWFLRRARSSSAT